jgi:hypothetical protein
MQIELDLSSVRDLPDLPLRHEEGTDDVRSILIDLCEALAGDSSTRFSVSGFGQERWPVDVRTDLAVLLEQLPAALDSLQSGSPFLLDFYEQGLERTIYLEPHGDRYLARCESHTSWHPDPAVEAIGRPELTEMLATPLNEIMNLLKKAAPGIAAHPWIVAWAKAGSGGSGHRKKPGRP